VIHIFVDGSAYYKSGLGGIGVYIIDSDKEYFISKGFRSTTISRMEQIALLLALQSLDRTIPIQAVIYSDSQYVTKSFTEHRLERWEKMNWVGVANIDLWKLILEEIKNHPLLNFRIVHIRGHQEDVSCFKAFGNAVADIFANFKIHKIYHADYL